MIVLISSKLFWLFNGWIPNTRRKGRRAASHPQIQNQENGQGDGRCSRGGYASLRLGWISLMGCFEVAPRCLCENRLRRGFECFLRRRLSLPLHTRPSEPRLPSHLLVMHGHSGQGEDHPMVKLTREQVLEIRRLY